MSHKSNWPSCLRLPSFMFLASCNRKCHSQTFLLKYLNKPSLLEKSSYYCFALYLIYLTSLMCLLLRLKMSVNRPYWLKNASNLRLVILVLWLVCYVGYGQFEDTHDFNNPAALPLFTQMVYRKLSNSTASLSHELATRAKFCVKDPLVSLLLNYILAHGFYTFGCVYHWCNQMSHFLQYFSILFCMCNTITCPQEVNSWILQMFWDYPCLEITISGMLIGTELLISPPTWISCLLALRKPKVTNFLLRKIDCLVIV